MAPKLKHPPGPLIKGCVKWKRPSPTGLKVKVVTDCSGIECPIVALLNIGCEVEHISSCEHNKKLQDFIKSNFNPKQVQDDVTTRSLKDIKGPIDVYVAGHLS